MENKDSNRPEISQEMKKINVKVRSLIVKTDQWFYNKPGWKCCECGKKGSSSLIKSHISRSEQAPGSVFQPRDESGNIDCDFLRPFWCNIKVDPER